MEIAVAVAIALISVARTARLIVWDEYPPAIWFRMKWDDLTGDSAWNKLFHCQFCLTPYLTLGMLVWMLLATLGDPWSDMWSSEWWWLVINGVWAGSYVAASIVAYDQPEE